MMSKKDRRVYRHWQKKMDKRIFIENISRYHVWLYVELEIVYYDCYDDFYMFERDDFIIKNEPKNIVEQVIIDKVNNYLQKKRLKLLFEEFEVKEWI